MITDEPWQPTEGVDCLVHDHPEGALLTTEGLPRCPWCRAAMPGGIGRGAAARRKALRTERAAVHAHTLTPTVPDHAQRAAGEHLEEHLW